MKLLILYHLFTWILAGLGTLKWDSCPNIKYDQLFRLGSDFILNWGFLVFRFHFLNFKLASWCLLILISFNLIWFFKFSLQTKPVNLLDIPYLFSLIILWQLGC